MKFSERIGKKQPRVNIQLDSMDDELRNGIWNVLTAYIIDPMKTRHELQYSEFRGLIEHLWFSFFKQPMDQIPRFTEIIADNLRKRFFKWDYLEVYDFIDFLVASDIPNGREFADSMNFILKREFSGYRFVNGQLSPITNEGEILEIEKAISSTSQPRLKGVNIHLSEALNKLSDKKSPDYRNSIKESISAVEALCQLIAGDKKTELGKALKELKETITIHGALEQGFIKIYGYTSDGDGIRHAMLEESNLDQEDALFMLVSCSAFINYLQTKAMKAGKLIE
ncbi:hypothetical protein KK083_25590 [Fulvivirgaceae bacterium PWU4]|uniref:HEPN AbiJ-N-terminal domain-containing protein n=1 Tax=Chryseosolibacter histidini TaxID=2782349 RepID=A0AAP2DPW4_9BACT|nr:hypothetical protein [Chryseosolibacter histidini]MBT1700286.1 hypothetical protein [Chryseosolibacter histidini]